MHGSLFPFFEDPLLLDCKALGQASKAISGPFRKINFITHDLLPFGFVVQLAWEQGCRSGESARLPPICGPGSNPGIDPRCGLSLLLVLSLAPRGFFRVLRFSPLLKNQHFQIPN